MQSRCWHVRARDIDGHLSRQRSIMPTLEVLKRSLSGTRSGVPWLYAPYEDTRPCKLRHDMIHRYHEHCPTLSVLPSRECPPIDSSIMEEHLVEVAQEEGEVDDAYHDIVNLYAVNFDLKTRRPLTMRSEYGYLLSFPLYAASPMCFLTLLNDQSLTMTVATIQSAQKLTKPIHPKPCGRTGRAKPPWLQAGDGR